MQFNLTTLAAGQLGAALTNPGSFLEQQQAGTFAQTLQRLKDSLGMTGKGTQLLTPGALPEGLSNLTLQALQTSAPEPVELVAQAAATPSSSKRVSVPILTLISTTPGEAAGPSKRPPGFSPLPTLATSPAALSPFGLALLENESPMEGSESAPRAETVMAPLSEQQPALRTVPQTSAPQTPPTEPAPEAEQEVTKTTLEIPERGRYTVTGPEGERRRRRPHEAEPSPLQPAPMLPLSCSPGAVPRALIAGEPDTGRAELLLSPGSQKTGGPEPEQPVPFRIGQTPATLSPTPASQEPRREETAPASQARRPVLQATAAEPVWKPALPEGEDATPGESLEKTVPAWNVPERSTGSFSPTTPVTQVDQPRARHGLEQSTETLSPPAPTAPAERPVALNVSERSKGAFSAPAPATPVEKPAERNVAERSTLPPLDDESPAGQQTLSTPRPSPVLNRPAAPVIETARRSLLESEEPSALNQEQKASNFKIDTVLQLVTRALPVAEPVKMAIRALPSLITKVAEELNLSALQLETRKPAVEVDGPSASSTPPAPSPFGLQPPKVNLARTPSLVFDSLPQTSPTPIAFEAPGKKTEMATPLPVDAGRSLMGQAALNGDAPQTSRLTFSNPSGFQPALEERAPVHSVSSSGENPMVAPLQTSTHPMRASQPLTGDGLQPANPLLRAETGSQQSPSAPAFDLSLLNAPATVGKGLQPGLVPSMVGGGPQVTHSSLPGFLHREVVLETAEPVAPRDNPSLPLSAPESNLSGLTLNQSAAESERVPVDSFGTRLRALAEAQSKAEKPNQVLTLELHPEKLGKVEINLTRQNAEERVKAVISVHQAEALAPLEKAISTVPAGELSISLHLQSGTSGHGFSADRHGNDESHAKPSVQAQEESSETEHGDTTTGPRAGEIYA